MENNTQKEKRKISQRRRWLQKHCIFAAETKSPEFPDDI